MSQRELGIIGHSLVYFFFLTVSPLMGPILAIVYGTMMKDARMGWKGLRAEVSGVLMIFLVGMICGIAIVPFSDFELGTV
jgi:hypothetical protein